MKFYSQIGQDKWVLDTVPDGKYFVDIGAGDGIKLSNTYTLEQQGWKGICAEPHRQMFESLRKNRNCHLARCCVAEGSRRVRYWQGRDDWQLLSGMCDDFQDGHKRRYNGGDVIWYKTISLNGLLHKYGAPKKIDYLSIDTEGSEYRILKGFDFNHTFKCITVEHNFVKQKRKAIERLLVQHGYRKVKEIRFEDWYVYDIPA